MKAPCWSLFLLAALLTSACDRSPSAPAQSGSLLETPLPATPVVALVPTLVTPTETPVPTIQPSPLEATLSALISPYTSISATIPASVMTLANTDILNDIATREASEIATAKAWAALPLDMGTPTVPVPRLDGLDLASPASWSPVLDETGFGFDRLVNAIVTEMVTDNPQPDIYQTYLYKSPPVFGGDAIGVSISRRGNELITDTDFPDNLINNQGEANWVTQGPFGDSAQVTMYVHGMRNNAPNPINLDFWNGVSPSLYVNVLNERCDASINFFTSFGMPGPAADALVKPLDQVVADHFPVLDHMYRSVQFPPECGTHASP